MSDKPTVKAYEVLVHGEPYWTITGIWSERVTHGFAFTQLLREGHDVNPDDVMIVEIPENDPLHAELLADHKAERGI